LDFWDNYTVRHLCNNEIDFVIELSNTDVIDMENNFMDLIFDVLSHDEVDPTINNNYLLKNALSDGNSFTANELIKHPLTTLENINIEIHFISDIIQYNWVYTAEKIIRLGDEHIKNLLSDSKIIKLLIKHC